MVIRAVLCVLLMVVTTVAAAHEETKLATRQMQAFHDVLHPLVHTSYPKKDYQTIRSALPTLLEKAQAIDGASLPRRFRSREKIFRKHSHDLVTQLQAMVDGKEFVDDGTLRVLFTEMHETFERMARILR